MYFTIPLESEHLKWLAHVDIVWIYDFMDTHGGETLGRPYEHAI